MVPQKFWKVVRAFCQQSIWEPVHWRRGLHVASIQNGVLPHTTCKYHLFSYYLNSQETFRNPRLEQRFLNSLLLLQISTETLLLLNRRDNRYYSKLNVLMWVQLPCEYSTQTVRVFYTTRNMKMKLKTSQEFQNSHGKNKKRSHYYTQILPHESHLIYKREYI